MKNLAKNEIRRLEQLIDGLADPEDIDETVHTTRKGIKRLRSYLRLARKSIGTTTYRVENGALRDTARLLAPARDAFVLIETASGLAANEDVINVLANRHREALAELESGGRIQSRRRLEAIAARWRITVSSSPDAASIGAGLRRTYRRGLVDFERVSATASDEAFHGWRRRTKYLRYQLEALGAPKKLISGYLHLGDDLGLEHDHTVLLSVCEECSGFPGFDKVAQRAVEQQGALRERAFERGAVLFSDEPGSFQRTVETALHLG
ncbi:MAG: CHAD domain-containing protein [Actinomycetota bacterium]